MDSVDNLLNCIASSADLKEEASGEIKQLLVTNAIEKQRQAIEQKDEEIASLKQDREQRKDFSKRIFVFMCLYMFVAISIVFCCGFEWMELDNSVLITLLSTTLANVIGVFTFVAKYLFHR